MNNLQSQIIEDALNNLCKLCNEASAGKGFWDGQDAKDITVALSKLALMHEEISEACDALRNDPNAVDKHVPCETVLAVEFADAVIRICDYCGARGIKLGTALIKKYHANQNRPHMHGKYA